MTFATYNPFSSCEVLEGTWVEESETASGYPLCLIRSTDVIWRLLLDSLDASVPVPISFNVADVSYSANLRLEVLDPNVVSLGTGSGVAEMVSPTRGGMEKFGGDRGIAHSALATRHYKKRGEDDGGRGRVGAFSTYKGTAPIMVVSKPYMKEEGNSIFIQKKIMEKVLKKQER